MGTDTGPSLRSRTCTQHSAQTNLAPDQFCPDCEREIDNAPDAPSLTVHERIAELRRWLGPIQVPFTKIHGRVTELVGRDVWTHELAMPELLENFIRDGGRTAGPAQTLQQIAPDKPLIVVETDNDGN